MSIFFSANLSMFRSLILAIALGHLAVPHVSIAQEGEQAEFVIAKLRESRESLASYQGTADIENVSAPISTLAKFRFASDHLRRTRRLDYEIYAADSLRETGKPLEQGGQIWRDDSTEQWIDIGGDYAGENKQVEIVDREKSSTSYKPFDVRAIGLGTFGAFLRGTDFETVWANGIGASEVIALTTDESKVVLVLERNRSSNGQFKSLQLLELDGSRDFVPVRSEFYTVPASAAVDPQKLSARAATDISSVEYEEVDGKYVPSRYEGVINSPNGPARTLVATFHWSSVANSLDPGLFSRSALISDGGRLIETRTPEPVVVEEVFVGAANEVPKPAYGTTFSVYSLAMIACGLLILLGAGGYVMSKKMKR